MYTAIIQFFFFFFKYEFTRQVLRAYKFSLVAKFRYPVTDPDTQYFFYEKNSAIDTLQKCTLGQVTRKNCDDFFFYFFLFI